MRQTNKQPLVSQTFLLCACGLVAIASLLLYPYGKASGWHALATLAVVLLIFVCLYGVYVLENKCPAHLKTLGYMFVGLTSFILQALWVALISL